MLRRSFKPTNLILNGDFSVDSNGDGIADNWQQTSTNSAGFRVENNTQFWTPLNSLWSGAIRTNQYVYTKLGNKYYYSGIIKNVRRVQIEQINAYADFSVDGKASFVFTGTSNTNNYVTHYGRTENVEASLQKVMIISLTEILPADILALSDENLKAWCDINLPVWFDGTLSSGVIGGMGGLQ